MLRRNYHFQGGGVSEIKVSMVVQEFLKHLLRKCDEYLKKCQGSKIVVQSYFVFDSMF